MELMQGGDLQQIMGAGNFEPLDINLARTITKHIGLALKNLHK